MPVPGLTAFVSDSSTWLLQGPLKPCGSYRGLLWGRVETGWQRDEVTLGPVDVDGGRWTVEVDAQSRGPRSPTALVDVQVEAILRRRFVGFTIHGGLSVAAALGTQELRECHGHRHSHSHGQCTHC